MIKCGCDKSEKGDGQICPGIEKNIDGKDIDEKNIDTNYIGGNNIDYKIKYRDKRKRGAAKFVPGAFHERIAN